MDAITYLMNRSWAPTRKWSLIALGCTLLSWINWRVVATASSTFPQLASSDGGLSLLWSFFQVLVGLTAVATFLGLTILAPLYPIQRATQTLQAWMRQRAVEEMVCAGLTGRDVLDRMVLFAGRWWLLVALPAMVLSVVFVGGTTAGFVKGLGLYLLGWLALAYFGLYITAWTGSAGGTVKMPLVVSMTVILGLPTVGMMAAGISGVSFLVATVYLIIASRYATIHALENAQGLEQMDNRFRRTLRTRARAPQRALAENPILARETLRGGDSGAFFSRLMISLGFMLALGLSLSDRKPGLLAIFFVAATLISCYRAASKMSQIVTEEIENGTLETVRSTPMGSTSFLAGWMRIVLRRQWCDLGALALATVLAMGVLGGQASLADSRILVMTALALCLPPLGALLGASIAGVARARRENGGQLLVPITAAGFFCLPQLTIPMTQDQVAQYLLGLLLVTVLFGWLLNQGAKKSLNRVFLPQK